MRADSFSTFILGLLKWIKLKGLDNKNKVL